MNKAFKTGKLLKLDESNFIKPDNNNGVVLVTTQDKYNDDLELVTTKQELHFPRVAQALKAYVDAEILVEDSIEKMIVNLDRLYNLIDSIDKTFKQF